MGGSSRPGWRQGRRPADQADDDPSGRASTSAGASARRATSTACRLASLASIRRVSSPRYLFLLDRAVRPPLGRSGRIARDISPAITTSRHAWTKRSLGAVFETIDADTGDGAEIRAAILRMICGDWPGAVFLDGFPIRGTVRG